MKRLVIIAFIIFSGILSYAQWNYPLTQTVDSSDTYFGVTYKDPYRWLEYMKQPQVENWFKKQSEYSNAILNNLNGRDELIAEWKKLDKLQAPAMGFIRYGNNRMFYKKTMPGENVGKLFYREDIRHKEQLLFDPTTFIKGETFTIGNFFPSHDGTKIAIIFYKLGAVIATLRVMDVDKRQFLKDSIYPYYRGAAWSFDDKVLFYTLTHSDDNKDAKAFLNSQVKLHEIGTSVSSDRDFFSSNSYPDLKIDPGASPRITLKEESRNYIFSYLRDSKSELTMYYAPITEMQSTKINWRVLCKPSDKLMNEIVLSGDKAYAVTYNGAKNFKLVETNLNHPNWAQAKVVAAEKADQTLESITRCKDFLFMVHSDGINSHISKYNLRTGTTAKVTLPYSGTANIYCFNPKTNDCFVSIDSWTRPVTMFEYNAQTNAWPNSSFYNSSVYPDEYMELQVKEIEVKGHDGVLIPLSIIYKKGTPLNGSSICLMDGYGAYGVSMPPQFNILENLLAVKGVIIAIPHVRGGGEKGEAWYNGGLKSTKPNTWKDFISCAEYLIEKGFTSPGKLAGTGTSAGGILISRAITERPDLFAAAICNVGVANALRFEFTPNGQTNIPEFGTVKDSAECKWLYEMDGVQHVKNGTKYPAVLCVAGWNDPFVIPWQPGKFAAALQNASASGKPVFMKVNYDGGHGTEDKSVTYADFADQFAFVLWQCGHPDFQLKK